MLTVTDRTALGVTLSLLALGVVAGASGARADCLQGQNCFLPNCFCPTFRHPNFNDVKKIPQIVYFAFDGALNDPARKVYETLFRKTRRNPNGCPISMTNFIQDTWTDYSIVREMYERGHEVAVNKVNGISVDTKKKLQYEASTEKDNIVNRAQIPKDTVVGWRSPGLKTAGDVQPDVLKKLGYTYDISLTYKRPSVTSTAPWPYTLDYGYPYQCNIEPCPAKNSSHKHFWEIPVNSLYDQDRGIICVYADSCRPESTMNQYFYLWSNFFNVYQSNRAPFGVHLHSGWFEYPDSFNATDFFIRSLLMMDDVYIVSVDKVLDWMRTPLPLDQIDNLPGWGCRYSELRKNRSGRKRSRENEARDLDLLDDIKTLLFRSEKEKERA